MDDQPVSGRDLRLLADRAWAAGQRELSAELHDLARRLEFQAADSPQPPSACQEGF